MKKYVFGVDVGGTTVKIGLLTSDGSMLEHWQIPTVTENGGCRILPDISDAILHKINERKLEKEDIIGIGLGVPGPVFDDGTIHKAANLGWGVFNVKETLSDLTGLPVAVGNDANVAALGEMWRGGGVGYKNVVIITLGTGVGGGLILDGKILNGTHGSAGELGHIPVVDPENEPEACGCGKHGCLEQYASAEGVLRLTRRYLTSHPEIDSPLRSAQRLSSKVLYEAVRDQDPAALAITDQLYRYLGKALSMVGVVLDPECILIGGGLSNAGQVLLDGITKYYHQYAFPAVDPAVVHLASLGNMAGMYGSAKLLL